MDRCTAKAIAGVLLTIGAMTAGVGLASGLAEAQPAFGPFVAPFPAGGPWTWGYGNVTPSVWDGPNPPEEGTATRQCPPISFMCP